MVRGMSPGTLKDPKIGGLEFASFSMFARTWTPVRN